MYVADNPAVKSLAGLRSIWFAPAGVNYFPVTFTVQWVQWHLWGSATLGYHLTNLALHLVDCALLGLVIAQLRSGAGRKPAPWAGGIAALLFAVHPLAVESVAWIAELKNVLSLAWLLGAALAYLRFEDDRANRRGWFWLALGLFILALLSKSTVVAFPAVLLLYAWWRRGPVERSDLLAAAPFALVAIAFGTVTIWFEHHRTMAIDPQSADGLVVRAAAAGLAIPFYGWKCLLPLGLMPNYPRWAAGTLLPWGWVAGAGALGLTGLLWVRRQQWGRGPFFVWALFVLNLAPTLGLISMAYLRISFVADHFAYLALAGFAAAVGWIVSLIDPRFRAAVFGAIAVLACGLAFVTRGDASIYQSEEAFWTAAARANPASWTAQSNLGLIATRAGRTAEAVERYRFELQLKPDDAGAHSNLATLLAGQPGRQDEAIDHYETALRLKSDLTGVDYSLASLLAAQPGRESDAIRHYEQALRLNPRLAAAENDLAGVLFRHPDRQAEAMAHYESALRIDPDFAEAHVNLGLLLARQPGRQADAAAHYLQAARLKPEWYLPHYYLGLEMARAGRNRQSVEQLEAAVRLDPSFGPAQQALSLMRQR